MELARNRALCQPPTGGAATDDAVLCEGVPGLRHLEVMSGIGDAAVVASISPEGVHAPSQRSTATPELRRITLRFRQLTDIIDRFELRLPRALDVAPDGELPCRVAEALPGEGCNCAALPGRSTPSPELNKAVKDELEKGEQCGGTTGRACNSFCVCALDQASGPSLTSCQNDKVADGAAPGYCYIDGEHKNEAGQPAPIGNRELVANCPAGGQRKLRFVGRDTPAKRRGHLHCLHGRDALRLLSRTGVSLELASGE